MPLHWARFLTVVAMGLAAWLWGGQQQAALDAHQVQWAQDLAFFHQILFHASQLRSATLVMRIGCLT